ncbi:hypothetical protein [Hyalangium versicolor]|uniref:hypothetical protein n=1 Tax=Hyalangium versicolor TaxID=2861190 RepID=UPI001CCC28AD|nr:hypothetical protein [Hyalangium versicolor]
MIDLVQGYYTSERQTALLGLGLGLALAFIGVVLWRTSMSVSLARGMPSVRSNPSPDCHGQPGPFETGALDSVPKPVSEQCG